MTFEGRWDALLGRRVLCRGRLPASFYPWIRLWLVKLEGIVADEKFAHFVLNGIARGHAPQVLL